MLRAGAYAATLTFFKLGTEELDLDTLGTHIKRLSKAGISGIIALGSNGEAPHLNNSERNDVVRTVRQTLDSEGYEHLPVVAGASSQSVSETIRLCHEAKAAGGNYVLVLPPSYFKAAMTDDAIFNFYKAVATASPLPVILYSFPSVVAGIDMSSDLLIRISRSCKNVVGTKFTCGDTGKLARVARAMDAIRPGEHEGSGYWAIAGLADFTLQGLVVGSSGVIAGGANVTPKACIHVVRLFKEGKLEEASKVQLLLSEGDWVHTGAGLGATKSVLEHYFGYGGIPRSPLRGVEQNMETALIEGMDPLLKLENSL